MPGQWQFCGLPVNSPLGVAAGPLLNGRWCLYYASLGFDVLTYKTVRSRRRECYDDLTAHEMVREQRKVSEMRKFLEWDEYVSLAAPHCALLVANGDADVIIDREGNVRRIPEFLNS